jgi:hypothetical protein
VDKLFEHLPAIITAAAQSQLGILALLVVALSVLAYFFFAKASEKARVGIFVLLFLGVVGFGVAMFRAAPTAPPPPPLSKESKTLLQLASRDPSGLVLYERFGEGVDLHSNGVSVVTSKADHEVLMQWEAALDQLVQQGLLAARGTGREIFEITKKGYDKAQRTD